MADLQPLSEKNYLMIRDAEKSLSENMIKQFFVEAKDGTPVIKKAGLLYKMNEKYGKGGYSLGSVFPADDEIEKIKKFGIVGKEMPFVLLKGCVKIVATGAEFTDYYLGTQANTFNMRNIFEITSTRSQLRCLRAATECGFYTPEELESPESGTITTVTQINPNTTVTVNKSSSNQIQQEEKASAEQKKEYSRLCNALGFTKDNPGSLLSVIKNATGKEISSTKNISSKDISSINLALQLIEKAKLVRDQDEEKRKEESIKSDTSIIEGEIVSIEEVSKDIENEDNETKIKKEEN